MARVLRAPSLELEIGRGDEFRENCLPIPDDAAALHLLRRFILDPFNKSALRSLLLDCAPSATLAGLTQIEDDEALLRAVASQLVTRRLQIRPFHRAGARIVAGAEPASEKKAAPAAATQRPKTWIKFRVVDDATGEWIPNAKLKIALPDGSEDTYTTNGQGLVEIQDVDYGPCGASAEFKGGQFTDTWPFVSRGGSIGTQAAQVSGTVRIAKIDAHKVRTGETLDGLAQEIGMTWKELAKFNWGTDDPKEINKALRAKVGCSVKDDKGNYKFDDSDEPGIVHLPTKWSTTGLESQETHTIRIRRPGEALVNLTIPVEMDLDDDPNQDDELRLRSEDGSYEKTLKEGQADVERDEERQMLLFHFREVPPGIYSVAVKIADDWCEILHDLRVHARGLRAWGQAFDGDLDRVSLGNPEDPEPEPPQEEEPAGDYLDHDHEAEG